MQGKEPPIMANMTFDEIRRAAEQLSTEEQAALIDYLLQRNKLTYQNPPVTRESLLAEFERRKASGAFENVESLRGKFADPALDLSFEEIQGILNEGNNE
jgi:hypothetical protein